MIIIMIIIMMIVMIITVMKIVFKRVRQESLSGSLKGYKGINDDDNFHDHDHRVQDYHSGDDGDLNCVSTCSPRLLKGDSGHDFQNNDDDDIHDYHVHEYDDDIYDNDK